MEKDKKAAGVKKQLRKTGKEGLKKIGEEECGDLTCWYGRY